MFALGGINQITPLSRGQKIRVVDPTGQPLNYGFTLLQPYRALLPIYLFISFFSHVYQL